MIAALEVTPAWYLVLGALLFSIGAFGLLCGLASFGAALPIPGLALGEGAAGAERFLSWRRTHPLLRDVSLDAYRAEMTKDR